MEYNIPLLLGGATEARCVARESLNGDPERAAIACSCEGESLDYVRDSVMLVLPEPGVHCPQRVEPAHKREVTSGSKAGAE